MPDEPAQIPASATSEIPVPSLPPAPPKPGDLDEHGHAYDPAKHIPVKSRTTKTWMARGGRKKKSALPGAASPANSVQPGPAAAPDFSELKKILESGPAETEAAGTKKEETPDGPTIDHSTDAAEVACRVAQFTAGLILDAPDDTTPPNGEHKHMVDATAAYIRFKGWHAVAGIGLALMFAAWLLKVLQKPKPRETVRRWFRGGDEANAVNVTPEDSRPAPSTNAGAGAARSSQIIDLPANIPPLAPQ